MDRPSFRAEILLHGFAELVYRVLVIHAMRPDGRAVDVPKGCDGEAK
jgi:hypothetical protein